MVWPLAKVLSFAASARKMRIRVLNLDDSLAAQHNLLRLQNLQVDPLGDWGPRIRLACSHGCFRRFERHLRSVFQAPGAPSLCLYGSGDFHHVTLALLRRQRQPFNLLVFDNHPDWMRGLPVLHCGTWLNHAARLPLVHRVFHVGGDVDFDNAYRRLAPWDLLRTGKIVLFPARRKFLRDAWSRIEHMPLRPAEQKPDVDYFAELIRPFSEELASRPLYISIDKDVLCSEDAITNWDSGHLRLDELQGVLTRFIQAARGNVIGADLLGDWSPMVSEGWLPRFFGLVHYRRTEVDPADAARRNESTNLQIIQTILQRVDTSTVSTSE